MTLGRASAGGGPLTSYNAEIMATFCRRPQCQAPAGRRCRGNVGNNPTRAHVVRVEDAGYRYIAMYVIVRADWHPPMAIAP